RIGDEAQGKRTSRLSLKYRAGPAAGGIVAAVRARQVSYTRNSDVIGSRIDTGKQKRISRRIFSTDLVPGDHPTLAVEKRQRRIERPPVSLGRDLQAKPPVVTRFKVDAIEGHGVGICLEIQEAGNRNREWTCSAQIRCLTECDPRTGQVELPQQDVVAGGRQEIP